MGSIETTRSELIRLFSEKLMITVDNPEVDLLASGLLDSSGLVDLLLLLEERFGIQLNLEELDMDDFRTCNSIAGLIAAQARPEASWNGAVPSAVISGTA